VEACALPGNVNERDGKEKEDMGKRKREKDKDQDEEIKSN